MTDFASVTATITPIITTRGYRAYASGTVTAEIAVTISTRRVPVAAVSVATGVFTGAFTTRTTLAATGSAARREFELYDDNVQAVTVRVASSGETSSFQVFGVEADAAVYGTGVQGGV